jgi:hypothetical protein
LEEYEKDLKMVQDLEKKLNISVRWEPGNEDWVRTGKLVAMRKYQRALDRLEGLIVARMFELTKMNMSQTGMCHNYMDITSDSNSYKWQVIRCGNTLPRLCRAAHKLFAPH